MNKMPATTVLILGMHRSGTSAVARVLNLLGVELGSDLLPPAADNESGFWEDRAVQFLHDRIYEDLGRDWTQTAPLPDRWWVSGTITDRAKQLRESLMSRFGAMPLWGIKDPRLATMLPVWRPILAEMGARPAAVLVFRNPAEVARSLAKRDGFAEPRSHLLWLRSLIDGVRNTAEMPRALTTYEKFLADWRRETALIASRTGLSWPAENTGIAGQIDSEIAGEIDRFLSPGARHHVVDDAAFLADGSVPKLLRDAYAAVLDCATTGDMAALAMVTGRIAAELDSADSPAVRFLPELEDELRRTVIRRNIAENELHARIGAAEAGARYEAGRAAAAEAETSVVRSRLADVEHTAADQRQQIQQLDRSLSDAAESNRELESRLAEARARVAEQASQLRAAEKRAGQIGDQLSATREELATAYRTRDTLGASLARTLSSRLWRWGRPAFWIARGLGRFRVDNPLLVPLTPATIDGNGAWTGSVQPMFLVPAPPLHGWVRIRAKIRASVTSRASLFLDTGLGFHERDRIDLSPVAGDTEIDRMIALKKPVYLIRFDPVRAPGDFTLESFSMEPMSSVWFNSAAVLKNLWRMFAGTGAHRPSIAIGLKLLSTGRWRVFHQQLVSNVESTTATGDYELWRKANALTPQRRRAMAEQLAGWTEPPKISVIVPVYNVDEVYLRHCLDSVLRQTYPHWELCVADDASTKPHVKRVLREYQARDPRVKVVYRPVNGHISAASNSALEIATGSYIALLDNDDEIAEHALHTVAAALVEDPSIDFIYSDEDKLTADGKHVDPFFKPDWSPEYLLACMYTCHLTVYRTEMVRRLGGWRSAFDTAQDYDLVLRVVATGPRIRHIPDVLYHWRLIPTSMSMSAGIAKPEAFGRARAAVQDYLTTAGRPARVLPGPTEGFHRVRYEILGRPKVSVIIPSACRPVELHGRKTWLALECVSSIRRLSTYPNIEIIVSDDRNIGPELAGALRALDARVESFPEPFNFSRKVNHAAGLSTGEHLVLLNDDTEVITPDWIEAMLEFSQQPEIGAVGAQLLFPNDTQQHNGINVLDGNPGHPFYQSPADHPGYYFSSAVHRNWVAVTGACLMTRRSVYESLGGFDDEFYLNYNDVDYCLRVIESGLRVVNVPYAKLYHYESVSKTGTDVKELEMFKKRWSARMPRDPYYNPNLTNQTGDFRIRV